jgi:hypothetical protein
MAPVAGFVVFVIGIGPSHSNRGIVPHQLVAARPPHSHSSGWLFSGARQRDCLIEKPGFAGPVRLYDLRHTALTHLAQSGADVILIQIAGHSDIRPPPDTSARLRSTLSRH